MSAPFRRTAPDRAFVGDVLRLGAEDAVDEKFTLSYALAQSAKLFVWEARVDETIAAVRFIPERLAATGRHGLTERAISTLIGKIFTESTQVNLHSEILDNPSHLWENDAHEPKSVLESTGRRPVWDIFELLCLGSNRTRFP